MEKTIPEADNSRDNICDEKSFCHATNCREQDPGKLYRTM